MADPNPQDVQRVEFALKNLGYNVGTTNGQITEGLKTSVRDAMADLCTALKIQAPQNYTPQFGATLLQKLDDLAVREKNYGLFTIKDIDVMRDYAQGKGYAIKTHDELTETFKEEGLPDRLISHMGAVVNILDNRKQFISVMNSIAPALLQPTPAAAAPAPAPAAQTKSAAPASAAPASSQQTAQQSTVPLDVKSAQELMIKLKNLTKDSGIDLGPGGADGKSGPKTIHSIEVTHAILGMPRTNRITTPFMTKLQARVDELSPKPPQAAPQKAETPAAAPAAATIDPSDPFGVGDAAKQKSKKGFALSDVQQNLFSSFLKSSPTLTLFLNDMLKMFTGHGLKDLLPGIDIPGLDKEKDLPADQNARLQKVFTDAYSDKTKTPAEISQSLKAGIEIAGFLPFGDEKRRKAFQDAADQAISDAQKTLKADKSNLPDAAKVFADALMNNTKDFNHTYGEPVFMQKRSGPSISAEVDPGVMNIKVEGGKLDIENIVKAYNNLNQDKPNWSHQALIFKDGDKTYIAGVERASNTFTVMSVTGKDLDAMKAMIDKENIPAADGSPGNDYSALKKRSDDLQGRLQAETPAYKFALQNYGAQFSGVGVGNKETENSFIAQARTANNLSSIAQYFTAQKTERDAIAQSRAAGQDKPATPAAPSAPNQILTGGDFDAAMRRSGADLARTNDQRSESGAYEQRLNAHPDVSLTANKRIELIYTDKSLAYRLDEREKSLNFAVKHEKISLPAAQVEQQDINEQRRTQVHRTIDITDDVANYRAAGGKNIDINKLTRADVERMLPNMTDVVGNYKQWGSAFGMMRYLEGQIDSICPGSSARLQQEGDSGGLHRPLNPVFSRIAGIFNHHSGADQDQKPGIAADADHSANNTRPADDKKPEPKGCTVEFDDNAKDIGARAKCGDTFVGAGPAVKTSPGVPVRP